MSKTIYNCKNVEFLLASKIIVDNFIRNLPELSLVRVSWTPEYAADLKARIDSTMENYIGLDKQKLLRKATKELIQIQNLALKKLVLPKYMTKNQKHSHLL